MRYRVVVTAEDIAAGKPDSDRECPVARALHRAFGHDDIEVDRFEIRVNPCQDDTLSLGTPDVAKAFIDAFDSDDKEDLPAIAPFTFELDVPDEEREDSDDNHRGEDGYES